MRADGLVLWAQLGGDLNPLLEARSTKGELRSNSKPLRQGDGRVCRANSNPLRERRQVALQAELTRTADPWLVRTDERASCDLVVLQDKRSYLRLCLLLVLTVFRRFPSSDGHQTDT